MGHYGIICAGARGLTKNIAFGIEPLLKELITGEEETSYVPCQLGRLHPTLCTSRCVYSVAWEIGVWWLA